MSRHRFERQSQAPRPSLVGVPALPAESPPSPLAECLASESYLAGGVRDLADLVGGVDVLECLDPTPLPDEAFDWTAVAEVDRGVVRAVLEAAERAVTDPALPVPDRDVASLLSRGGMPLWIVDLEFRTVVRRLIALVARHDAPILHRSPPARLAAAFVWLALHGNGKLGRGRSFKADYIWWGFEVTDCAERGRALRRATGVPAVTPDWYGSSVGPGDDTWLPDAALLHSSTRRSLVTRREHLISSIAAEAEREAQRQPVRLVGDGQVRLLARQVIPRGAVRATVEAGRSVVFALFGAEEGPLKTEEVLALSISDARLFVTMLEKALDGPLVSGTRLATPQH